MAKASILLKNRASCFLSLTVFSLPSVILQLYPFNSMFIDFIPPYFLCFFCNPFFIFTNIIFTHSLYISSLWNIGQRQQNRHQVFLIRRDRNINLNLQCLHANNFGQSWIELTCVYTETPISALAPSDWLIEPWTCSALPKMFFWERKWSGAVGRNVSKAGKSFSESSLRKVMGRTL